MILNTNYKIPEITFNTLCVTIARLGFDQAFDIAFERSLEEVRMDPESVIIAEYLSWSHHLTKYAALSTNSMMKCRCAEAALFYRKLAHHLYWAAKKSGLVEYNPYFIQAVK